MSRKFCIARVCTVSLVMLFVTASGLAQTAKPSKAVEWVYRDKIRMGWTPERFDQYQMMKDAGMNAVMPRLELDVPMDDAAHPYDKPLSDHDAQIISDMLQGSALAKKVGLKYFHCLNFAADSQTYEGGTRDNPARYNDGHLPSPVDPVFYKRTILDRVERTMKLLGDKNKYALDAVIIDPEMYALGGALPGDPDYGKFAFELYLKESKKTAPASAADVASRKKWLEEQKLDAAYVQWQFDRIKLFGTQLRELVHRQLPNAILGYIIYEDRMWFHAMAAGLTTPEVPVFIGPESTYSGVMDQSMIDYFAEMRKSIGVPCMLVPGIDMGLVNKQVPQERLNVLTGNVYQRCQHSEGYWVYAIYNFGSTSEEQGAFFAALKKIDDALDETAKTGKVVAALKAAPLPVVLPPGFEEMLKTASTMQPLPASAPKAKLPFEVPMLRGSYVLLSWPEKGERQQFTIRVDKLGNYLDNGRMQTFSKAGALLQENPVPHSTNRVFWIPDAAGAPCPTAVAAGQNRWVVEAFTGKLMIYAGDYLGVNAGNAAGGKFYFNVPSDRKDFGLMLTGEGNESVDYSLFDPSGNKVKSWSKVTAATKERIAVTQPGVWCISVDHLVDDGGFALTDLPNFFALRGEDVMVPAGK